MTFKFDASCDYEVWALIPSLIVQKNSACREITIASFFLAWGVCVDISW